jgi:hypothetical protein
VLADPESDISKYKEYFISDLYQYDIDRCDKVKSILLNGLEVSMIKSSSKFSTYSYVPRLLLVSKLVVTVAVTVGIYLSMK